MTEADVIAHWRKGARDAFEMAQLARQASKYDHALFNCHLAVEKALKTLYMEQHNAESPFTHNLLDLAETLDCTLSADQRSGLDELTDFVVGARYSDMAWAEEYADAQHAEQWISWTQTFLTFLGL